MKCTCLLSVLQPPGSQLVRGDKSEDDDYRASWDFFNTGWISMSVTEMTITTRATKPLFADWQEVDTWGTTEKPLLYWPQCIKTSANALLAAWKPFLNDLNFTYTHTVVPSWQCMYSQNMSNLRSLAPTLMHRMSTDLMIPVVLWVKNWTTQSNWGKSLTCQRDRESCKRNPILTITSILATC